MQKYKNSSFCLFFLCASFFLINSVLADNHSFFKKDPFIETYKQNLDVKVLDNGIAYKVIKQGNGKLSPSPLNEVETHYEGRFISGDIFDSSYKRGRTSKFRLNQVIPGWTFILQKMVIGDKWEVVIPSHLAYGSRKVGPIPANSTLIFTIELVAIN